MTAVIAEKTQKTAVTPMMQQYLGVKEQYKDCLLLYRMGDFYELFLDDAIIAAKDLEIALTKRGQHKGEGIPMCGVPHHSVDAYLHKLIAKGHKVAICEQLETPEEAKKRGYKAIVKRDVVRIITSGTLTEDELLGGGQANFLLAITIIGNDLALAWTDISTGEVHTSLTSSDNLQSDLMRLSPKEIILNDKITKNERIYNVLSDYKDVITTHVASFFDSKRGENNIKELYQVRTLESFGNFSKGEIGALGALIEYISLTQKGKMPYLSPPARYEINHFMTIDAATRKHLELTESINGNRKNSLLGIMNRTATAGGFRLLSRYLANPLANAEVINQRLDLVSFFVGSSDLRDNLANIFKIVPDMERAVSRISLGRATPKDLTMIRDGLGAVLEIASCLEDNYELLPECVLALYKELSPHDDLRIELQKALMPEVKKLARDGDFIARGYSPQIDELRNLQRNSEKLLQEMKLKYQQKTGVNSLKITRNNVIGYYVEVTAANSDKMSDPVFVHRQTMLNAIRYTTDELKDLEHKLNNAAEQILALELQIFSELVQKIINNAATIILTAHAISKLDVVTSLGELSFQHGYIRPNIDDSNKFEIKKGRHPIVEANLFGELEGQFIANDCNLNNEQKLWLLTGPNMAGKSTFLRQNAVITIMAQIGCFVPAEYVHIGAVDKLFSRIGASDDLSRGRSTFMVEMVETATILNQATSKSLIIMDEIGRGTATYDGLAIAWAVLEHIHNNIGARTLFATHYHELVSLSEQLAAVSCHTMKVKEWNGNVVFLHEVVAGKADNSYGVHVAKLAGLPRKVTNRASKVLESLQQNSNVGNMPLFMPQEESETIIQESAADAILKEISVDDLSPREALEILYKLKEAV